MHECVPSKWQVWLMRQTHKMKMKLLRRVQHLLKTSAQTCHVDQERQLFKTFTLQKSVHTWLSCSIWSEQSSYIYISENQAFVLIILFFFFFFHTHVLFCIHKFSHSQNQQKRQSSMGQERSLRVISLCPKNSNVAKVILDFTHQHFRQMTHTTKTWQC